MLTWTGHPLVDVGIAAITAYSGRSEPAALTEADLTAAADYLARLYTQNRAMRNHIAGMVFHNSPYIQWRDQELAAYVERTLYSWRAGAPALAAACAFCGQPSAYRASRRDVPMLNGERYINFNPAGEAGLPVCGACSLALHMLPLGCFKCGGFLLAAHSTDPSITLSLAGQALREIMPALALPDLEKLPSARYEKTRLVELLVSWAVSAAGADGRAAALTGYAFTNSGKKPDVRIFPVSSAVVTFLRAVQRSADGTLTAAWTRAAAKAWVERPKETDPSQRQNRFYEALLGLPANAREVLRRFIIPVRHWGLAALFVRSFMNLSEERIDLLRKLGDRFADYAAQKRSFFFQFARTNNYSRWRRELLRAVDDAARGGQTLISFDEFVEVFTAPSGELNDWKLMRDLIVLRMLERGVIAEDEALFDENENIDEPLTADEQEGAL
jgi:CRISPR-associated protein Cst1